ncbi:MAG: hypothetical protein V3T17_05670 [Pseudomonadales bacterium]
MITKINDFLNGGDSKSADLGRAVGFTLNRLVKISRLLLAALVLVGFGQFGQYMTSANELRMHTINNWMTNNPEAKILAERFVGECLGDSKVPYSERSMEDSPFGIYECGNAMGANDLVTIIRDSDSILMTAAWLLTLSCSASYRCH